MVFMAHGLAVGMFMCAAYLASLTLWRARRSIFRLPIQFVAAFLGVILLLCKSTGALIYAIALTPVWVLMRARAKVQIAGLLTVLVMSYPALRILGAFPTDTLVQAASSLSVQRAASLEFRFDNEDQLVNKARERLWFGWGGFGRALIYDDQIGKRLSVTDGHWIILFGQRGLGGFIPAFALLLTPVMVARRRFRRVRSGRDRAMLAGLALIVAVYSVDLLPNGLFSNIPYFLAGALWSLSRTLSRRGPRTVVAPPPAPADGQSVASTKHTAVNTPTT